MTSKTYTLGGDLTVNRLGYGAMRLTGQPGNFGPYPAWADGVDLLRHAASLGVGFFDSAWAYGPEHADRIVGEALAKEDVVIATKGGVDKPEPGKIVVDGSPETLLRQVNKARINLNREQIDLFQLHRVDPETPIEDSVSALAQARADGLIRHIGLSNVSRDQLERALAVAPIASVQNRFNMADTEADALVDYTAERGIAFIPYGPLGANPMQPGANLPALEALAWLLRRSPNIIAIPGTTKKAHLEENMRVWETVAQLDREGAQ